jgi:hypothetical protein
MRTAMSKIQIEGEGPMNIRHRGRAGRLLSFGLAAGLLFALAGDWGGAQTYNIVGVDPLEVLELKLKPNVIVVLDSSGSMVSTLSQICAPNCVGTSWLAGDHPASRMARAKKALKDVMARNETKVSFAFASYTQEKVNPYWLDRDNSRTTLSLPKSTGWQERQFRFLYYTSDVVSMELQAVYSRADAISDDIQVARATNDTMTRGLQAWQQIDPVAWGSGGTTAYLYFKEGKARARANASSEDVFSTVYADCAVPITSKFYRTGDELASELQTKMNTCGANDYYVWYDEDRGNFRFRRYSGGRDFIMFWNPNDYTSCSASDLRCHPGWRPDRPSIGPALGASRDYRQDFYYSDDDDNGTFETYHFRWQVYTYQSWTLAHRTSARSAGGCADNSTENEACYVEDGVTFYNLYAARFWNGETIVTNRNGEVCDVLPASNPPVPPGADGIPNTTDDRPVLWVRQGRFCGSNNYVEVPFLYAGLSTAASADRFENATDTYGIADGLVDRGNDFGMSAYGNSNGCGGVEFRADLRPCDSGCLQFDSQIAPWLEMEMPLDSDNLLISGYNSSGSAIPFTESHDGTYRSTSSRSTPSGGIRGSGSTPIAKTLRDIKGVFTGWWDVQGPSDCASPDGTGLTTAPLKDHLQPAAPTIVAFVSDGNDTCASGNEDTAALDSALAAEELFTPVDPTADPGTSSSVRTYMIAFGEGADPTRLNWISWGGSGLGQNRPDLGMPDVPVTGTRWDATGSNTQEIDDYLRPLRAQCDTCTDALVARDGDELGRVLQALIDQGASSGTFSAARQSITDSVYEYVWQASGVDGTFAPDDPDTRYQALAPTRFISTFSLPGYRGELTAWQAYDWNGDTLLPDAAWSAGDELLARVQTATAQCATPDQCTFGGLRTFLDRRIYTTDGNGVYGPGTSAWADDPAVLATVDATVGGTVDDRVTLWPPDASVLAGDLDDELGIPNDLLTLKTVYGACAGELGATLPLNCQATASAAAQLAEARKEARQMILAFMAGAEPVGARGEPRRETGSPYGILYQARSWVLADTTQATPALLGPPLQDANRILGPEYTVFQSGPQALSGTGSSNTDRGCGLRDPEPSVAPTMTVLFLPANDMLHALRAGPCVSGCGDSGGEELWGFVPYDLLPALRERFVNDPPSRDDHVYMLARGVRYADVFIRHATTVGAICGGSDSDAMQGVWRRVAFLTRGAGGKYVTALDVTSAGDYTTATVDARGPIPLWSRGNPDYEEATRERTGSTANHNSADVTAYDHMGETWSIPVVALVDHTVAPYDESPRDRNRPVDHALFMGSGYGDTSGCGVGGACEGTTFYTLDALTGDVIATADVGQRPEMIPGPASGPEGRWPNALVANAAGFNPRAYGLGMTVHPSSHVTTRVYIGDLHGRLWKFLTVAPDTPIELANLSTFIDPDNPAAPSAQAVGTAAGLIGLPPYQGNADLVEPYVYVTSGYERRADGPFKIFGFKDTGGDTDIPLGTPVDNPDDPDVCPGPCNVRTYDGSAGSELIIARPFDEGTPGSCVSPIEPNVFRGTVQPATTFELCSPASPTCTLALGRVFFGGTRLNLPGTAYAPPTPIACGDGTYPCRSSFDSIVYALGAETGVAAYDINASGDDAYRIYRDQRISAISMAGDPAQGGGSRLLVDEGQLSGAAPVAPPAPGVPPQSVQSGSASVIMSRDPNFPPPAVRMSSSVCQ